VLAMQHDRLREARILLEGALEIALANELHAAALRAYNNLSVLLWSLDEWQANIANIERALELARRVGHRNWEANFVAGSIGTLDVLGRWDEALARAEEANELATNEFARGLRLQVVRIFAARGEFERARALLVEDASIARSENPDFAGGYSMIESCLLRAEGNLDGALAASDRALALGLDIVGLGKYALFEALQVAADRGDLERLRTQLARLDGLLPGQVTPSIRAHRARFRAYLPEADSDAEFRIAERVFGELQLPFFLALTQLEAATRLLADGRTGEAEPLLAAAGETFERLRAAPWLDRVARLRTQTPGRSAAESEPALPA